MPLSADQLAGLFEASAKGLTPVGEQRARSAAAHIRANGVTAERGSLQSRSLVAMLDAYADLMLPVARERFAAISIYGVDTFDIQAFADPRGPHLVVFDGLLHLIHYFADYVTVLGRLMQQRGAEMVSLGGAVRPEPEYFAMAAMAQLADFISHGRVPITLHDMLSPAARRDVKVGFSTAVVFLMLHELAHLVIASDPEAPHDAARHTALLEPEDLDAITREEFDADLAALAMIEPAYRGEIISSLLFLLGSFAILESFNGGLSASHPLAINRLSLLADASELPTDVREFVTSWIEDRAEHFRASAPARAANDGDITARIESAICRADAAAVILEVRRRVAELPAGHLD